MRRESANKPLEPTRKPATQLRVHHNKDTVYLRVVECADHKRYVMENIHGRMVEKTGIPWASYRLTATAEGRKAYADPDGSELGFQPKRL